MCTCIEDIHVLLEMCGGEQVAKFCEHRQVVAIVIIMCITIITITITITIIVNNSSASIMLISIMVARVIFSITSISIITSFIAIR